MSTENTINQFVLVIEDKESDQKKIVEALKIIGLRWELAPGLAEAKVHKDSDDIELLILDLYLPPELNPRTTLDWLKTFRAAHPIVPIVIFSMHNPRPEDLRDIITAQAGYFYRKPSVDFETHELVDIFKMSLKGVISYSSDIAYSLPTLVQDAFSHGNPLTSREWSVALLVCDGLNNDQIAQRLAMEPGTVRSHTNHILAKLEEKELIKFRSQLELCAWIKSNRLKYQK